ncbi:hypothetical protein D3C86_1903460 [compost metagenome]
MKSTYKSGFCAINSLASCLAAALGSFGLVVCGVLVLEVLLFGEKLVPSVKPRLCKLAMPWPCVIAYLLIFVPIWFPIILGLAL